VFYVYGGPRSTGNVRNAGGSRGRRFDRVADGSADRFGVTLVGTLARAAFIGIREPTRPPYPKPHTRVGDGQTCHQGLRSRCVEYRPPDTCRTYVCKVARRSPRHVRSERELENDARRIPTIADRPEIVDADGRSAWLQTRDLFAHEGK